MDRFKSKLSSVPQTPRPTTEVDAVGTLLDICVQRNLPLAKYVEHKFESFTLINFDFCFYLHSIAIQILIGIFFFI